MKGQMGVVPICLLNDNKDYSRKTKQVICLTRCLIDGISHDGQGVGRLEGLAVFVPGALPGETVDIEVTQRRKNFARARLNAVLEASPYRTEAPCPYYWECGGCDYQHAEYDLQLELKTRVVDQTLQRVGKIDTTVNPCLPSPDIWRYRNKVAWHGRPSRDGWHLGYYRSDCHDILEVKNCLLISESMQEISNTVGEQLRQLPQPLPALEITVRQSSVDHKIMVIVSGIERKLVLQTLEGQYPMGVSWIHHQAEQCSVLSGEPLLREQLHNTSFEISPMAFFQVNHGQAEQILKIITQWLDLQGNEVILDAYCGVGSLALPLAGQVRKVMGIEAFKPAVKDAQANARLNGLRNTRFLAGLTEDVMPTLTNRFDAVILDPPRSGCAPGVVQSVARLNIPRVVYVSCEPSTLARDLALFKQAGYYVKEVQPLDMFPWTRHVETVVLMSRVKD